MNTLKIKSTKKKQKSPLKFCLCILVFIVIPCAIILALKFVGIIPSTTYGNNHFGFDDVVSTVDYNKNGVDDYKDIMLGARADIKNKPTYDGQYWGNGGYPPEDIGVCTDVVWRGFKNAGYCLRDMVSNDIQNHMEDYPRVEGTPDRNIDFRRVPNLMVFFGKYAQNLTLDINDTAQWQAGDIVTFDDTHIGIISDKRNANGIALLIHQSPVLAGEVDRLLITAEDISGHYRFDASKIDKDILVKATSDNT